MSGCIQIYRANLPARRFRFKSQHLPVRNRSSCQCSRKPWPASQSSVFSSSLRKLHSSCKTVNTPKPAVYTKSSHCAEIHLSLHRLYCCDHASYTLHLFLKLMKLSPCNPSPELFKRAFYSIAGSNTSAAQREMLNRRHHADQELLDSAWTYYDNASVRTCH